MKSFILLMAMLSALAGGLAACNTQMQGASSASAPSDADEHNRGGY